jgi:hypothetical protein
LKTLLDTSKISSNSYSFFWGNEVTDQPRDGSLTLGGYDQALIAEGPNVTVPFGNDIRCKEGIIVTVTSLELQGGDAWKDLPDLEVCVIPATSNIMTIPGNYWDPIQTMMGVELNPTRNGTSDAHFYNTTVVTTASACVTNFSKVCDAPTDKDTVHTAAIWPLQSTTLSPSRSPTTNCYLANATLLPAA